MKLRARFSVLVSTLLLFASPPALAAKPDPRTVPVIKASEAVKGGKPADAVTLLDPVIASFEAEHKDGKQRIYCVRHGESAETSQLETLTYMLEASAANVSAVALDSLWCDALFLKGFALIDLGRAPEAEPYLKRVVEMAPQNAHYLAEWAEFHKSKRDWQTAHDLFERAVGAAEFSDPSRKPAELGRALRGVGFTSIELGKLDEAEQSFNAALKLNPTDRGAQSELDYLKQLRTKPGTQ
jgi:tetratricopeptide (TPR) repeat protein